MRSPLVLSLAAFVACTGDKSDVDSGVEADTDTDADSDGDTDADSDGDTDADSDADTDADSDADTDADSDADTDADPPMRMTLLTEPFDDDSQFTKSDGLASAAEFFSDGTNDYWGISDGTTGGDFGADTPPDVTGDYTGFVGTFLTMQDLDGEGLELPVSMTWSNIDISGATDLEVSVALAEALAMDGNNDFDEVDFVRITASIDGAAAVTVAEFSGEAGFNSPASLDADLDGFGDGVMVLTDAAQPFTFPIVGQGAELTLVLEVSVDAGDEDVGVDDIEVTGLR